MGWARIFVSLILWILLSITCAPLFLLLCIYRFILGKVVPLLYKDVERLLTTTSSNLFMANGKSFHTAICLGFEGKLELNEARSKFESSVIYKKDSKGQLQWPELQQFVVNKFGHVFWQWDPIFTIKNHFRVLEGNEASNPFLSPQDVLNLLDTSILAKEFPASRSPWEVVIIPNFKDIPKLGEAVGYEGTVLVFHFDHCLGDGAAVFQLFREYLDVKEAPRNLARNMVSPQYTIWEILLNCFYGPYNMGQMTMKNAKGIWYPPCKERSFRYNLAASPTIPSHLIKNIRRAHNVSFSAVVLTAFGKALQKFLTEAGYELPKTMTCESACAVPGHPITKLRNHFSIVESRLFLDGGNTGLEQNEASIGEDVDLRNHLFRFLILQMVGLVWKPFMNMIIPYAIKGLKVPFSNAPFLLEDIYFDGRNQLKTAFVVGKIEFASSLQGSIINVAVSCSEGLRLVFQIDDALVSKEKLHVDVLMQYFTHEIMGMQN